MKQEDLYQAKVDKITAKKTVLMQKVILLMAKIDAMDTELEELEKAEIERSGLIMIKQILGETKGNMIIPEQPNLN
jgi:hypothetical protein